MLYKSLTFIVFSFPSIGGSFLVFIAASCYIGTIGKIIIGENCY
jgi:hypothetical protein